MLESRKVVNQKSVCNKGKLKWAKPCLIQIGVSSTSGKRFTPYREGFSDQYQGNPWWMTNVGAS